MVVVAVPPSPMTPTAQHVWSTARPGVVACQGNSCTLDSNPDVSGGQGISEPAGWQPVPRWVDCILLSQPSFGAYVRHMYLSIATLPSSNRSWGTQTALWGTPGFPSSNAVSHIGLRQPLACVSHSLVLDHVIKRHIASNMLIRSVSGLR
jgi:hypothetical protein